MKSDDSLYIKMANNELDIAARYHYQKIPLNTDIVGGRSVAAILRRNAYGETEVCMWAVMIGIYERADNGHADQMKDFLYSSLHNLFETERTYQYLKNGLDCLLTQAVQQKEEKAPFKIDVNGLLAVLRENISKYPGLSGGKYFAEMLEQYLEAFRQIGYRL